MPIDARSSAEFVSNTLTSWLVGEALPTWWAFGIDHATGAFRERLGTRCEAIDEPRRTRVLARQIAVFAAAARMGWTGPAERAVRLGLDDYLRVAVLVDGTVRMRVAADGAPLDETFSLYDQAFALYAFAEAERTLRDGRGHAAAQRLRDTLTARYRHPVAGFEEGDPPKVPLKANPHMHLLESFLAWEDAGGDGTWSALADELAQLCLARFIDRSSGCLTEFFAADWSRAPGEEGRIVEPGHLFEWAWLLTRWGDRRGRDDAIAAARRLVDMAEAHGVDRERGVAVNEILDDGSPRDPSARLWPQTERIKGHMALATVTPGAERAAHLAAAAEAGKGLLSYLDVETPGLWRDRMDATGGFRVEPAPASSFYHLVVAIEDFGERLRQL